MQLHTIIVPAFFIVGVIGLAFWQRAAVVVVHGIRLAQQSLHDDIQGAERPLDAIPRWARFGALEGAVLLVRAQIRWLWGDLHACEDFATRAIRADRFAVRAMYSTTTSEALAIRALARAATNRLEDARGDLETVDTDTAASFSARAYASLARAVVLAYDRDASGLRDHLRRTRDAIAVVAHPREILLLRALERRERGVPPPYRSHAGMAMSAGGHAWLRTVVPSLVELTEGEAAQAEGEAAQATAESQDPGPASVPRPPSPGSPVWPRSVRCGCC